MAAMLTMDQLAREGDRFAPALEAEANRELGRRADWAALLGALPPPQEPIGGQPRPHRPFRLPAGHGSGRAFRGRIA